MATACALNGHGGADEGASPDGNMKMLVDWSRLDWPIPDHQALIDDTLSFAAETTGFEGRAWRGTPILSRGADGTITRNDVIYHTRGFDFHG
jgi:hypothetical protein